MIRLPVNTRLIRILPTLVTAWTGAAAQTTPPGALVYLNERNPVSLFSSPGMDIFLADDLSLTRPQGCDMVYYDLLVIARTGSAFDVQAELWNANPCDHSAAVIEGTFREWSGVPADGSVHRLSADFTPPVGIPGIVWMKVAFSTPEGGWVIADQAELGETADLFASNGGGCNLYWFGGRPPFPFAGFWASIRCEFGPPPMGACCVDTTCEETTKTECKGRWRGPATTCDLNPCGVTYLVYDNRFVTGTFLPLRTGTQAADDLRLASSAVACDLARYELAVTGRIGTAAFSAVTELWTNDLGTDGIPSADDLPLAPIPGTAAPFVGIRADQTTHNLLAGPFPGGINLPEKVWIVVSTSTDDSGPITAGLAEIGSSEDRYAVRINSVWEWRSFGGFDPTDCPGSPRCIPAGSFRAKVFCYGEGANGACCDDAAHACTTGVPIHDCPGRWHPHNSCTPSPFDPPCLAPLCPAEGAVEFLDPPDGVVDARQPHPLSAGIPPMGIRVLRVRAPAGADADCFQVCEPNHNGGINAIAGLLEEPPGEYFLTLNWPLTAGAATTITYTGTDVHSRFVAQPGNVNGDAVADVQDILAIMECLAEGPGPSCPWGFPYSLDIDRDGLSSPSDILRAIDLLNGAEAFRAWHDVPLPLDPCP